MPVALLRRALPISRAGAGDPKALGKAAGLKGLSPLNALIPPWDVDGGVTATGVLSRQRGNLITTSNTQ